ncbi:hypothetical protein A3715_01590 [Oleiphilus sp. HI0009]|nr:MULTISPECIES: hydroxyacylglutathione hydrolase [unclassified Oleiphilus]KZX77480.1 hypothetical protein A3715_01590 [Oleiphilus sp. HI0009]KZY69076.1 hypothetical protein A3739_01115 [Oleiphilus sp. HI0067]KZY69394.1 hypothetical protein A3738_04110 [Oleiphilus sp. HI0066]MCH2159118.1 hydroxyacylglutathione hydrolase [Oleiphilaceae bacterium]
MAHCTISTISAFRDNYIWCIHDDSTAVIVDPGDATPVLRFLEDNNLDLEAALVTHHHPDHVGGIQTLGTNFPNLRVIGSPESRFGGIKEQVREGDSVIAGGNSFSVIDVPGHTLDHIAFVLSNEESTHLFCGDTLFSAGCGRLFEGTAKQMHDSLRKLQNLPAETQIYCAHEYTLSNLDFALSLMPNNKDLQDYHNQCTLKRENNESTIPTTLSQELKINPFLRESDPEIIDNLQTLNYKALSEAEDRFAAIRHAKDNA